MLNINGRGWQTGNASVDGDGTTLVSQTVGSRTALTCTAATGTVRAYFRAGYGTYTASGPLAAAAAAIPTALLIDAWLAFPTLSLAPGASEYVFWLPVWNGAAMSPTTGFYFYLVVSFDGAAYTLQYKRGVDGYSVETVTLATITASTTFHRYTLWLHTDKTYHSVDGGAVTTTTHTTYVPTASVYPGNVCLEWQGAVLIPAWDALRVAVEEHDAGTTAGKSRTNGNPDTGTLYLISKTGLAALVTAGTAYEVAVANGAFTSPSPSDDDYLAAKVLSDNDGGVAVKVNFASGAVTRSNWSLT